MELRQPIPYVDHNTTSGPTNISSLRSTTGPIPDAIHPSIHTQAPIDVKVDNRDQSVLDDRLATKHIKRFIKAHGSRITLSFCAPASRDIECHIRLMFQIIPLDMHLGAGVSIATTSGCRHNYDRKETCVSAVCVALRGILAVERNSPWKKKEKTSLPMHDVEMVLYRVICD
jgi:hypothetical protein